MSATARGHLLWYIPDGYIPTESTGSLVSHESICVLNTGGEPANLAITVFYEDREPLERIPVTVAGRRTAHIRTALLEKDGQRIPPGVPYALEVESDIPVLVQYSRLDATQPANALMTTLGYPIR